MTHLCRPTGRTKIAQLFRCQAFDIPMYYQKLGRLVSALFLNDHGFRFSLPKNYPRTNIIRRYHISESGLQKAIKRAVQKSGLSKRITAHTFRHSYATHLLENGTNIRVLQKLMGHKDVKTTEIYTHVMQNDIHAVKSPLDSL